jgi:hypothetical protein
MNALLASAEFEYVEKTIAYLMKKHIKMLDKKNTTVFELFLTSTSPNDIIILCSKKLTAIKRPDIIEIRKIP